MRKRDQERFRRLLLSQREEILTNARRALGGEMNLDPDDFPDEIDTASSEVGLGFLGRLRERERGLLKKINTALQKIDDGVYGQCESCGEVIEPRRLEARPVAELCIDCKEQQEKRERGAG